MFFGTFSNYPESGYVHASSSAQDHAKREHRVQQHSTKKECNTGVQCDVITAHWAAMCETCSQTREEQTAFLSDGTRQDR